MKLATRAPMTRRKNFTEDPKKVRDLLWEACAIADEIHLREEQLIYKLQEIDQNRYYVRLGFNSLRGFCIQGLKFSKAQAQRIATRTRHPSTLIDDGQLRDLKTSGH